MAKGSCRCKKSECEECPEWIFTFADLVMLMMGFFVILWVIKPAPTPKPNDPANQDWLKVAAAIREAFGYIPDPTSKDPVDIEMLLEKLQKMKLDGPKQGGTVTEPKQTPEGTAPEPSDIRPGKQSVEGGKLLFDQGQATLNNSTRVILNEIADIVRGHRNIVIVKGHTSLDDYPESATPQQKMDLSIRRAQAVSDYLITKGVAPEILRVQGCSTFEPVIQRVYTPDSQALNRRVEVEVSATLVEDLQDRRAAGTPVDENNPTGNADSHPSTQPSASAE